MRRGDRSTVARARAKTSAAPEPDPDVREFLHVDPGLITFGANVRHDTIKLDPDFVASVHLRGVMVPVVAYRDGEDLVLLYGKRRTLAATTVGLSTIPVYVVEKPLDEEDRLTGQVIENEHREALTVAERIAAYEQLAALGLTAAQIAKRTALPRADVDAGLKAATSTQAREVVAQHDLTMVEAAAVAEFADTPGAVDRIVEVVKSGGGIDHVVQQLRDQREEDDARAAVAAELAGAGVKVIDRPGYRDPARRLDNLAGDLTPASHASCPGHAAYVEAEPNYELDEEPEDKDAPDPYTWRCEPVYVCTNPAAYGHKLRWADNNGKVEASPAEREQASAERREVIEGNKAWDSAEKVRRAWLRQFAARKTAPKTAAAFVARALAACGPVLQAMTNGNTFAHELFGLTKSMGYTTRGAPFEKLLEASSEGRAQLVALALVLAAHEESTGRQSWRNGDANSSTARYLRYLEEQGYELSDVELRACGVKPKARKTPAKNKAGAGR